MIKLKLKPIALAIAVSVCGVSGTTAYAVEQTGNITGSIQIGTSQGVLPGASIIIRHTKNGYSKTVIADEDGKFRLTKLPVGTYTVSVTNPGYEMFVSANINVAIGKTAALTVPMEEGDIETISVQGAQIAMVDTTTSTSSLNITSLELDALPISRDITSIALLADGTVKGDSAFGNLASFTGSSVAENAYFVNGLNTTEFRRGLGGIRIPHTAYAAHEVKSGGYGAQHGKATGGVLSSVTKSGTNDFEFGVFAEYTPNPEERLSPRYQANVWEEVETNDDGSPALIHAVGDLTNYYAKAHRQTANADFWASGPIIEDTLFFYALYSMKNYEETTYDRNLAPQNLETDLANPFNNYASNGDENKWENDDPEMFVALDWFINEDHSLKIWGMDSRTDRTQQVTNYAYTKEGGVNNPVITDVGTATSEMGGYAWAINYDAHITDDLTISAMYGKVRFNNRVYSPNDDTCPVVWSWTKGEYQGCSINPYKSDSHDTREQYQINGEWYINSDHLLRFGLDVEDNISFETRERSGGAFYGFHTIRGGVELRNGYTPAEDMSVVQRRNATRGGEYGVKSQSFYLDHTWTVTDDLTVSLGLRNESYDNVNTDGDSFLKVSGQWSPRVGIAWDIDGDGESKVFANYGRYFLPVAGNTNVRLAGGELSTTEYFTYTGRVADRTNAPILGEKLGETYFYDNGITPNPKSIVDNDIEPMYKDEIILGYQTMLSEDWSGSVKFTHSRLSGVVDDVGIDYVLDDMGWVDNSGDEEFFVLTNPGSDMSIQYDTDGDGVLEDVVIPGEKFGFDEPKRHFNSVTLGLTRAFKDNYSVRLSYVWSQTYGNTEGAVKSDNGQSDTGLTRDWDSLAMMDGAYGFLPNDRTHVFKAYGIYTFNEDLSLGLNASVMSGTPISSFGKSYAPDPDGYESGPTFYIGDRKFQRGSWGRTPWLVTLDAVLNYKLSIGDHDVNLKWTVNNLFDARGITGFNQNAEKGENGQGYRNENFMAANSWQAGRSMKFTLDYKF